MGPVTGADGAHLVLASASPRRLELLRLAGLDPAVRPTHADESTLAMEDPWAAVERVACAKVGAAVRGAGEVVLAADTVVVIEGRMLGKPRDADHAVAMLTGLSGRSHRVATGVAVEDLGGRTRSGVFTTEVTFAPLSPAAIDAYVATGEAFGKAGAYAIQGAGAVFVERLQGSWTNVVGLPVVETLRMLRAAGVTTR